MQQQIESLGFKAVNLDFSVSHFTDIHLLKYSLTDSVQGISPANIAFTIKSDLENLGFRTKTFAYRGMNDFECLGEFTDDDYVMLIYRADYESLADKISMILTDFAGKKYTYQFRTQSPRHKGRLGTLVPVTTVFPQDEERIYYKAWIPAKETILINLLKRIFEENYWKVAASSSSKILADSKGNKYIAYEITPLWSSIFLSINFHIKNIKEKIFK